MEQEPNTIGIRDASARTETAYHNTGRRSSIRRDHPMLLVDQGVIKFRTRLFRIQRNAVSWARSLEARTTKAGDHVFADVEIVRSDRAKGEAWYIQYLPASEHRQDAIKEHMQAERVQRALIEQGQYKWEKLPNDAYARLVTTTTGNRYHVTVDTCTCDDFLCRCKTVGIWCKHILAFNMTQIEGDVDVFADDDLSDEEDPWADDPIEEAQPQTVRLTPEQRQEVLSSVFLDF